MDIILRYLHLGMCSCLQAMLQVVTYITAIEVTVIEFAITCIIVFSLGVANSNGS